MRLALLHEVTEDFAAYLSEVTDGDLTASTPCQTWTIDDLYHHMIELNAQSLVAGMARETVYRQAARHTADMLASAADRLPTPFGALSPQDAFESYLTNTVVHTWDLAHALGLDFDPRPDAIDIALGCLCRMPPDTSTGVPGSAMAEVLRLSGR